MAEDKETITESKKEPVVKDEPADDILTKSSKMASFKKALTNNVGLIFNAVILIIILAIACVLGKSWNTKRMDEKGEKNETLSDWNVREAVNNIKKKQEALIAEFNNIDARFN